MKRHHSDSYIVKEIRPIIFGIEDSIVSTLGVVVGIAASGLGRKDVLIAGIILVLIEAISMGGGEYISSKTDEEVRTGRNDNFPTKNAVAMFLSYTIAGVVPLVPFALFPATEAIIIAASTSAVVIFFVGVGKARYSIHHVPPLKSGLEMLMITAFAAVIGYLLGIVASRF